MILNLLLMGVHRQLVPVGMLRGRTLGRVDLDGEWILWLLPLTSVGLLLVCSLTYHHKDIQLMTSTRLPNTGDSERLRPIPWYLPLPLTWIKLTGSIPIRPPHYPPPRSPAPIQPLDPTTLFLTAYPPHRVNWSDRLHCVQGLERCARGIGEVLVTVHWGDC
jgi:hypothetical protein